SSTAPTDKSTCHCPPRISRPISTCRVFTPPHLAAQRAATKGSGSPSNRDHRERPPSQPFSLAFICVQSESPASPPQPTAPIPPASAASHPSTAPTDKAPATAHPASPAPYRYAESSRPLTSPPSDPRPKGAVPPRTATKGSGHHP